MLAAIAGRIHAMPGTVDPATYFAEFLLAIREARHDDALRLARQQPAVVGMRDAVGNTALHWAAHGETGHPTWPRQPEPQHADVPDPACHVAIAQRLLELGADPRACNDWGETPLHLAVSLARDAALTRLLLESGADPTLADASGNTAMHLSVLPGPHTLVLATLVHGYVGPQALPGPNAHGLTPCDIARGHPDAAERDVLLALLHEGPAPPALEQARGNGPRRDPPWLIALRMARAAIAKAQSEPARRRVREILSPLTQISASLPEIGARQDAAGVMQELLRRLCDLLAMCAEHDVVPLRDLLRAMKAASQQVDSHPQAWRLYVGYAELWRRTREWPEALAYAHHARRLAARSEDAGAMARAEQAIDDIELAAVRHHLSLWAPALHTDFMAAFKKMETQWRDTDDLTGAMQSGAVLLRAIARAHDGLLRHGVPAMAQAFAELARPMAAPALDEKVRNALSAARQRADQASAFRALAEAILALAPATAWHDIAACGSAWCLAVANAVAEPGSSDEVRSFARDAHMEAAEALQYAAHARGGRPERLFSPQPAEWRAFRLVLTALRERFAEQLRALPPLAPDSPALVQWQATLPIEALQQRLTMDLAALIATIAQACVDKMLKEAPVAFAVLGLGSMSRTDMGPYSDFEYAIVVAHRFDPSTVDGAWYHNWHRLFQLAVFSIGESSPGADHPVPVPPGLHLDHGAAAMMAHHDRMLTPDELARAMRERHEANDNDTLHTDQDVAFSLLAPCLAYGSESLARDFANALSRQLDIPGDMHGPFPCAPRQDMALRQMLADVSHLRAAASAHVHTVDLKAQFAGPLQHGLTILALLYGLPGRTPQDMLAQLALSRRFTPAFVADWRWALATVQHIRLQAHVRHGCHRDELAHRDLTPEEGAALRNIELRVVRPLWRAFEYWLTVHAYPAKGPTAVLQLLHGLNDCDPALLGFEAEPDSAGGTASHEAPAATPAAADSLVATLVHRQADAATVTAYYCRAMARTARSQYGAAWVAWREGLASRDDAAGLVAALGELPCGDGWRGKSVQAQHAFHQCVGTWLDAMTQVRPSRDQVSILLRDPAVPPHLPAPVRRYALRPDIQSQLFESGTRLRRKPDRQRGRHTLLPVRFEADGRQLTYWLKFHPENAAMETLVQALDRRISGGSGLPCNMICKLETPHLSHPALIMESAGDDENNLAVTLRTHPAIVRELDRASFTRALLRVLLTNPEDDKADDYFVHRGADERLHLRRVDNERAFFSPEERRFFGANRVQVKSILYCLDDMQEALDGAVLDDFSRLSPMRVVQSWLVEAQMLHRHYRELFSDADMAVAIRNGAAPGLLTVGIADGLEQEIVKRIDSIHGVIQLARIDGMPVTGMTLLRLVQPALARHYERAFREIPVYSSRRDAASERFVLVTGASYDVNEHGERRSELPGIAAVSRSLHVGGKLHETELRRMARGEWLSPTQALLRLQDMELRRVHDIVAGMLIGKRADLLRFSALPTRHRAEALGVVHAALLQNPAAYDAQRQERMLRAVAGVAFQELALTGFAAVLDDALLEPILQGAGKSLRSIDLSGCWRLTQASVVTLAETCADLRVLRLRNMQPPEGANTAPLKALRKGLLSIGVLRFPELRTLDVGDCPALTDIHIDAPELAALAIDGCTALGRVHTASRALAALDAKECESLTEDALRSITLSWAGMRSVQLDGCVALAHIGFRERFPWIAAGPWNPWNESQMARWEATLQAALDELDARGNHSRWTARTRLHGWLQTRNGVVQAMGDAIGRAATLDARLALAWALDPEAAGEGEGNANGRGDPGDDPSSSRSLHAIVGRGTYNSVWRLENGEPRARAAAARSLGQLGASAPGYVTDALLAALRDREGAVVRAAAHALARIAIWPRVSELVRLLQ